MMSSQCALTCSKQTTCHAAPAISEYCLDLHLGRAACRRMRVFGLRAWGIRPQQIPARGGGTCGYRPLPDVDVAALRARGKHFRVKKLPARTRPAALAGAAGQPDGGDVGAPGRPSALGARQAAAQGQAACCGGAAAGPERAPPAGGAATNRESALPAEEGPAAGPERAPPAEGGTWLEVIHRLLKDLQPSRWLTCQEIARCAAGPRNTEPCCLIECCLSSTSTSAWSLYSSTWCKRLSSLWASDVVGACGFCGAFLMCVIPDWTLSAELGCLAFLGRLVQEKTMKASADPEKYVAKALEGDIKHNSASLFAKRDLEPTPGRNRHVPTCTSTEVALYANGRVCLQSI